MKWLNKISGGIQNYSFFITFLDLTFISLVGENESLDPKSYDYKLREACPFLYKHLNVVGLRVMEDPAKPV
jgi:hypothetical protein